MTRADSRTHVIPERIQLETVFGCNARCTMCPVHRTSERKKGIMSFELFKYVVDELAPYKEHINKFDLWGLGEPLLDKNLSEKVNYAKKKGFRSVAIATNADLLSGKLVASLYKAGLDTIIFSIDGIRKLTHESIRINTDFDRVVENAEEAIARRNEGEYATRFVFRFIRQLGNRDEWEGFRDFWGLRISKKNRDVVIGYDMHTWGGEINVPGCAKIRRVPDSIPCHHVFDRLIVLWDGTVPLCCSDLHRANYAFGKIGDGSPIEIFNSVRAQRVREIHKAGKRLSMKICAECTILESEAAQEIE